MKIAKYRDERIPNCWILTDFTMEQLEGRIAALQGTVEFVMAKRKEIEEQIAALTERCKELEKWASEHGLIILDKKEFWKDLTLLGKALRGEEDVK